MLNWQAAHTVCGGVRVNSNLVRFICRAKVHVDASRNATVAVGSPVTIHERAWAYCPAGARSEHVWESIDPVTLADLKLIEVARARETTPEDSRS
jgi:hypothetical protein